MKDAAVKDKTSPAFGQPSASKNMMTDEYVALRAILFKRRSRRCD